MYVLEQATNFKAGLRLGNSGNVSSDEHRDILVDELFRGFSMSMHVGS